MYQVFPLLFLYFSFIFPLPHLRLEEIKKSRQHNGYLDFYQDKNIIFLNIKLNFVSN